MFFINGVIPQKTTPRNNLWQNVLYVKKMSVTIVPAPLLGIFESLSSGMILRNTDALCIAHTHVVHCHQFSFQCLLAIFTCCFTIFFSYRSLNYEQSFSSPLLLHHLTDKGMDKKSSGISISSG